MAHYGHLLVETLSTTWAIGSAGPLDHFVFHPFTFGGDLTAWAEELLAAAGVDLSRVLMIDERMCFEEILIPERLFRVDTYANVRMRDVYLQVADRLVPPHGNGGEAPAQVFLSRAKVPANRRRAAHDAAIEAVFSARGFDIIHPQEMSVTDQVRLYRRARILAGLSGSALHNVVFAPQGTILFHIGDDRTGAKLPRTQAVCNELAGARCLHVPASSEETQVAEISRMLDGLSIVDDSP